MAIGVPKAEILHSTLVELRPYDAAYKLRRRMEDERDYFCGIYTFEAVSTAISNAFRGKGKKAEPYRKKPILEEIEEHRRITNPTKEEKEEQINAFFAQLTSMQKAFERKK